MNMNNISYKTILSLTVLLSISLLLNAAAVLSPSTMPTSTIASYAVSTTNLENVTTANAYRPWFENGAWQGDLIEYDMSSNGSISTSIDLSTVVPTNKSGANWSARLQFDKKTATYYSTRLIITTDITGPTDPTRQQTSFEWSSLSDIAKTSIDSTTLIVDTPATDTSPVVTAPSNSLILDFIRGDRSNEANGTTGTLRKRYNILGDIIHNDPVYVGAPNSKIFDVGYSKFRTDNASRAPRVYVGANDGMLHVFNADTGDEVYAFVPSTLFGKLNLLAKTPYAHQYYVDGALAAGDMVFTGGLWGSILVGSYGAGGKGLFALDITKPNLDLSASPTDKKVLWELDERDQATGGVGKIIGNIYDKSEVVKLSDGNWYVVTGNGYGSTNGSANLLLIDSDGAVTVIDAEVSNGSNGLSRPTLIDKNGDGAVDYAYAGDLLGNMYRFNLSDLTSVVVETLFSAGSDKPITTAPKVASHPFGGRIVLFATGSLLSKSDVGNTLIQSIYGIRDIDNPGTLATVSATNLFSQTLSGDVAFDANKTVRYIVKKTAAPTTIDWTTDEGWVVDLPAGERVSLNPNLRAGRFQVMSVNPVSKEVWLIQLDFYDGAASNIFYNLYDQDQSFDGLDTVNRPQGNPTGIGDIPVALKQGIGFFSRQLILRVANGVDANFINGVALPPATVTCVTDCPDGFARGHIDVDTDTPGGPVKTTLVEDSYCYTKGNRSLATIADSSGSFVRSINSKSARVDGYSGSTDNGHQHEYDKAHGTVDVDYINLEGYCFQDRPSDTTKTNGKAKLSRATEAGVGNSTTFFVIVANADLSPGSTINIGKQSWNVVQYQKLIQQKLEAWDGVASTFATALVDNNGNSLIHTIDDIKVSMAAGTGKLSNSFNDRAIIDGGLLPTISDCVKGQLTITNDRWRNGALIMQLINVEEYKKNPSTVIQQFPGDLPNSVTFNGITTDLIVGGNIYGGLRANHYGNIAGARTIPNSTPDKVGNTHIDPNTGYPLITGPILNPAFLYESTLFWHYGDLYKALNGSPSNKNDLCYGGALWPTASALETNGFTQAELFAELLKGTGKTSVAYQDLIAAINRSAPQSEIDSLRADFNKLYDKIKDYINEPTTPGTPTSGTKTVGEPNLTADKTNINDRVRGPNGVTGRRTWIDIR